MRITLLLVFYLLFCAAPTGLFAQQEKVLLEAKTFYRSLTNGLVACGLRIPNRDMNILVDSRQSEALRFRVGTDLFELNVDRSPLQPHLLVRNYESHLWAAIVKKVPSASNKPIKLMRDQAEAKAKEFAGHLGPKIDPTYRFDANQRWKSRSSAFDPRTHTWTFAWHRHVGNYPVFSEQMEMSIDDETGSLANCHNYVRDEPYALVEHPLPTPDAARKRIEEIIHKVFELDRAKPEKGYLHPIDGPFLVVASPRHLTAEQVNRLGKTPDGKQRVRLAWVYHFWISPRGKPTEERLKQLHPAQIDRALFDAETFEIIPL